MLQKHSILSFLAAKEKEKYNQLQSNPTWYHQDKTNQPEKCTAVPQRSDKAPDMSPGLSKAQEDISWCRGSSPHTCLWQSSRAVLPSLPPTLGFPSTSEKLSSSVPVAVNCELWLARWVLLWDLLSPASELPLKWDQLTVRPLNGRCEGVRPPEDQRDIRHPGLSPLSKGRAGAPLSRVAIRAPKLQEQRGEEETDLSSHTYGVDGNCWWQGEFESHFPNLSNKANKSCLSPPWKHYDSQMG
jgi:hypothetical protein